MSKEIEFIPYEEALALKELGFDWECFKSYQVSKYGLGGQSYIELMDVAHDDLIDICHAPLYQQAFRWFREKHGLMHEVNLTTKQEDVKEFEFFILNFNEPIDWEVCIFESDDYKKYEEAELDSLRKLIEFLNQKKDE